MKATAMTAVAKMTLGLLLALGATGRSPAADFGVVVHTRQWQELRGPVVQGPLIQVAPVQHLGRPLLTGGPGAYVAYPAYTPIVRGARYHRATYRRAGWRPPCPVVNRFGIVVAFDRGRGC